MFDIGDIQVGEVASDKGLSDRGFFESEVVGGEFFGNGAEGYDCSFVGKDKKERKIVHVGGVETGSVF